uniref:SprT-like domain-containing protein Spartan (Trinotate prediction) n=1 Tax=Henneguya salminicola TaxID=69463 RepID=A0A6G3MMJ1_HENSL
MEHFKKNGNSHPKMFPVTLVFEQNKNDDSDSVIFIEETNIIPPIDENEALNNIRAALPIIDPVLEFLDPNPDIHALFCQFSKDYFYDSLPSVEVKWSKRMTL